jgi:hypothetical protein
MKATTQRLVAFAFGVVFVIIMLVIAIWIPRPTESQWFTFRVVLALAAGGVGALIPGLINVEAGPYVRAGGALALFVLVYWFNPPKLVVSSPSGPDKGELHIPALGKPLKVHASLIASGEVIERKTVWHPLGRMGTDNGPASFYIDSEAGNVNSKTLVCPAAESGYEVDTDPAAGFSYGMTDRAHVVAGGDKYWDVSQADRGCIHLYCDGRNGSSHVWISNVQVREKRTLPTQQCHPPIESDTIVRPGELKKMTFDLTQASGACNNARIVARVAIRDEAGNNIDEKDLSPAASERALDGWMTLSLSPSGVLEAQYRTN